MDGGDNWTTGAISRTKLQSNHHHQQTNIQFFTGQMPFLLPNQQCQSTEGNIDDIAYKNNPTDACTLWESSRYPRAREYTAQNNIVSLDECHQDGDVR